MDFSADDLRRIKHRHGDEPLTMMSYYAVDCTLADLIDYTAALRARLAAAEGERDAANALLGVVVSGARAMGWSIAEDIERHLTPAPTEPEGGDVADGA